MLNLLFTTHKTKTEVHIKKIVSSDSTTSTTTACWAKTIKNSKMSDFCTDKKTLTIMRNIGMSQFWKVKFLFLYGKVKKFPSNSLNLSLKINEVSNVPHQIRKLKNSWSARHLTEFLSLCFTDRKLFLGLAVSFQQKRWLAVRHSHRKLKFRWIRSVCVF